MARRMTLAWVLLAVVAAARVAPASAALGLRMPVIPYFSVLRGGYVDLLTRQPVATSYTAAAMQPGAPAAAGGYQRQNGLFNPAPRPTSRTIFPITIPSLDYWEKCFKETDPLSALITKCNYQDTFTTCSQLGLMGYLPKGVQAFEANTLTGSFNIPTGCTAGSLGVAYDRLYRLTWNSPQVPILAVITKDPIGSMVSYFGTGATQGRLRHRLATKAEFCYAPTLSEISISKSAIYATGMQPGTAAWQFSKSVALAGPYASNRAVLINGDAVDATWTISAQKVGTDVTFQGVVSGQISINNPTPALITVSSIIDQITNGPTATVTCPVGTPFTVPACSFATCQYTAYYPVAPPPGTYSAAAQVAFTVLGSQGYPSTAQGSTMFNVGSVGLAAVDTSMGSIPAGAAMVTDPSSPERSYMFNGGGSQSFTTAVTCDGDAGSGPVTSAATLTGANGQQITQSASVTRQCYDLQVSVVTKAAPFVGRYTWSVSKTASPTALALKPDSKVYGGGASVGADYADTTTGDVVYTVTYARAAPAVAEGEAAFEASGEAVVFNPAPVNARLQGVFISISHSRPGGEPYVTEANCPVLLLPAGQRVTCTWSATPTFNPIGQPVRATARYLATRNGEASGATTDFNSAPATIGGGGAPGNGTALERGAAARRGLLQTFGGGRARGSVGVLPELGGRMAVDESGLMPGLAPAVATTLYAEDGTPIVVPNGVADGSAVLVSGGGSDALRLANLAAAFGLAQGRAVGLNGAGGITFNEAGPAEAGAQLSGLQDACVEVSDTFVEAAGGKLVSGTQPTGRICSSMTFTYTMRYGPYADCAPRKAVNAATFQAVDTKAAGSDQADVAIALSGCANPGALRAASLKVRTSAVGGYTWAVTKRADRDDLALGQDATGTVTYTVDVRRSGTKAGATVGADAAVTNPTDYPVAVESATYTATTMCDGAAKTTSGPVTCDAATVPARGKVGCKLSAVVPCAGNGAYTIVLVAGGGFTLTSTPTPFAFNASALAKAGADSACADVRDAFTSGQGRVGGALVAGTRPNGRLCGSRTFTYTVKFGPFGACGGYKAISSVTLKSNSSATKTATATSSLPISVVGCSVYTAEAGPAASSASDCVAPPAYWANCDEGADAKCAAGWGLLPGGTGKDTPFFPAANARATRTFASALAAPLPNASAGPAAAGRAGYLGAARQYAAFQLNFLSGARLPTLELQDAYDGLAAFLASTGEAAAGALPKDLLAHVGEQAALLARYNAGGLPSLLKGPPRCAA
ncbi:MAG: hypothetical protein J3K34DRAFT_525684 [Monoraphidium minutum]|nr:MAG: hypothetical protein J3K34DRAFT_525684 [Monoraphidium minutum]